jgi:hypothetical protein
VSVLEIAGTWEEEEDFSPAPVAQLIRYFSRRGAKTQRRRGKKGGVIVSRWTLVRFCRRKLLFKNLSKNKNSLFYIKYFNAKSINAKHLWKK